MTHTIVLYHHRHQGVVISYWRIKLSDILKDFFGNHCAFICGHNYTFSAQRRGGKSDFWLPNRRHDLIEKLS